MSCRIREATRKETNGKINRNKIQSEKIWRAQKITIIIKKVEKADVAKWNRSREVACKYFRLTEGPEEGQCRGLLGVLLLGTAGEVDKATMHSRVGSGDRRRVT